METSGFFIPEGVRERPAGIVFDMDGVLFDSETACVACWEDTASAFGLAGIRDTFLRCVGTNRAQTERILSDTYGAGIVDAFLSESGRLFRERYGNGRLPVKPGAKDLLAFLSENGVPTGLASSSRHSDILEELSCAGLLGYFGVIVGGDAVKVSKPDPEIYLLACEAMRVPPERAYAVEDSFNGIRSAHAAGMRPLMVPDLVPPDGEMRRLSFGIFRDLSEVRSFLETLLPPRAAAPRGHA